MNKATRQAILRKYGQGYRPWAIAAELTCTEEEVREVLRQARLNRRGDRQRRVKDKLSQQRQARFGELVNRSREQ